MSSRSLQFTARSGGRYWWHHWREHDYVPLVYRSLTDEEWQLTEEWFADTDDRSYFGDISVPSSSMLAGIISGSAINALVQCGADPKRLRTSKYRMRRAMTRSGSPANSRWRTIFS
jgi:hypothetical protein